MADAFEDMLSTMLAPPERTADRKFVAKVQARIMLDERLSAERRMMVDALTRQVVAVIAVAAAVWWLGRAGFIAMHVAEAPAVSLAILLGLFACFVALISRCSGFENAFGTPASKTSRT